MTSLPWLRLYTELLSDRKIKLISAETGLPKPLIIGVWVSLLMLAGESPERGRIISARGKPWPFHFIADEIGLDEATCQRIIEEFISMDMVFLDDEGVYVITKWEERQFKSDDSYARVKKFRANKPKAPEEKGGIDNDGYTKRFNSDNGNVSKAFQETPQIQSQSQNLEERPPDGDPHPDKPKRGKPQVIAAAKVFVEITGKSCLSNAQIKEIDRIVGCDPSALEKWGDVVKTWLMRGYKLTNAEGMLDWFRNGIPAYTQKNKTANELPKQPRQPLPSVNLKLLEQLQAESKGV